MSEMECNTKFKMSIQEMLDFNDECDSAARHCPQYQGSHAIADRIICLGEIKPKQLVKHWLGCDILWESGYSEHLSADADFVFSDYTRYKHNRRRQKVSGECHD